MKLLLVLFSVNTEAGNEFYLQHQFCIDHKYDYQLEEYGTFRAQFLACEHLF